MVVLSGHPCHTLLPTCVPAAFVTDILATWQLLAAVVLRCSTLACYSLDREHRVLGARLTELHSDMHANQGPYMANTKAFVPLCPHHACSGLHV